MTRLLKVLHARPIEREFEGWIVAGIERYFRRVGLPFAIWAVSPSTEAKWPADQKLAAAAKIVGLQFKQAKIQNGSGDLGFDRLYWTFDQPPKQHKLVITTPEIFYCLPTFVNRSYRSEALEHCLFWRPKADSSSEAGTPTRAWYDNSQSTQKSYNPLKDSMRWGRFIEGVISCELGKKIDSPSDGNAFLLELSAHMRRLELLGANEEFAGSGLYLLAFPLADLE